MKLFDTIFVIADTFNVISVNGRVCSIQCPFCNMYLRNPNYPIVENLLELICYFLSIIQQINMNCSPKFTWNVLPFFRSTLTTHNRVALLQSWALWIKMPRKLAKKIFEGKSTSGFHGTTVHTIIHNYYVHYYVADDGSARKWMCVRRRVCANEFWKFFISYGLQWEFQREALWFIRIFLLRKIRSTHICHWNHVI